MAVVAHVNNTRRTAMVRISNSCRASLRGLFSPARRAAQWQP